MGVVVSLDGERKKPSLDGLTDLVADDLRDVNELIIRHMDSPVDLIPQLASHLIVAGGKRLRPVLTLASARMCGYEDGNRHIALAACVEFIHTATLLHDDVVDESGLRRGLASANAVFGRRCVRRCSAVFGQHCVRCKFLMAVFECLLSSCGSMWDSWWFL